MSEKKIRVTHTVVITALVDMAAYRGMTPEEAVAWETGQTEEAMLETVLDALALDNEATAACKAEVVEA